MKKIITTLFGGIYFFISYAQERNFWTPVNENEVTKDLFLNRFKPVTYRLFRLNELLLKGELISAPSEKVVSSSASSFIISIPSPDGLIERYRIVEAPVMHPDLAAKYPGIKSYAGKGIDDPASTIRFDFSPEGFHAMILSSARKTIYIDAIDRPDHYYVVFSRKDIGNYQSPFQCLTENTSQPVQQVSTNEAIRNADDARLRTYRLALAASGEYSTYFLDGTETTDAQRKAKVLAAMNTAITRANGIYERDFGIRLVLVANNDAIIYLNASTDPWTTELNTKTQTTIDNVIGSANYDIGHLVHRTANNGNAGCIGCVCKAGQKGSGFTSHTTPEGDPFVVDYLTHEMGHQFGANHTFAFSYEGTIAQCEPGSGSTIMGYAGITGANTDIQPHSDDYFHALSIEQITDYIKSGTGGGACAAVTLTGNSTPTASGGGDFTIPKSTPFTLTGTGTDADETDQLTFDWEQIDARTSNSPTTPSSTATAGPVFRSFTHTSSSSRTFPALASILNGTNTNKWEVLPSVQRTLNFRFTVRDNVAGGANNKSDDILVTVSGASGPFSVSAPNTAITWNVGTSQTVAWNVGASNVAPVNCANVTILLSIDGGNSFPITLSGSSPNDGSQIITVPNNPGTQCRVKVQAIGNIFFDISNTNFTISGTAPTCSQPGSLSSSAVTTNSAMVSWTAVAGANNYTVDYKTSATSTWTNAVTGTTATSVNLSGLNSSTTYDWRVLANCTSSSSTYSSAQFTTQAVATCNAPSGLTSSNITSNSATATWNAVSGANSYDVDYKTSATSTWSNAATATTSTSVNLGGLNSSTSYDWRVRANCASAGSGYSNAQFTTNPVSGGCVSNYEANESLAAAATVSTNTNLSAGISSSTDKDWYKFSLSATSNLNITLSNLPADYDIIFYNSAGTEIKRSENGSTTNETINNNNTVAGTYYLQVFGYNGANSTSVCYNLNIGASGSTLCQSSYDVSTNGTSGGAAAIPLNTNVNGLISPAGDIDFYKFVITTGGTITITLTTLPADYDVILQNSSGAQVGLSQNGSTTSETINYTAAAGTYYVRVYGYNNANNSTQCYTLKVATGSASRAEDYITASTQKGLRVFPDPAKYSVNVQLENNYEKADIRIFDSYGRLVIQKKTSQPNTSINISKLASGIYLLNVITNNKQISTTKFVKE